MIRPGTAPTIRLPRAVGRAPSKEEFDGAMLQLEAADAATVKQGVTPALPGLILMASDGSSWRVVVDPGGALRTVAVAR